MVNLFHKYLQKVNITDVSKQNIQEQLLSHQDYPSLKAITDTLNYFRLENITANVPKDALFQLPNSFLGLIEDKNGQELVQVLQTKKGIKTRGKDGKTNIYSTASFQKIWTGTLIAVDEGPKNTLKKIINIKLVQLTGILGALLCVVLIILISPSIMELTYTLVSALGVLLSILVIKEDLGYSSVIIDKVCGVFSQQNTSCNSVIKSEYGKLTKEISFSDLSLLYFTSTCLSNLVFGIDLSTLFVVATLSIPIISYSIYVQLFKLKEICVICLGIGALLITQVCVLYFLGAEWSLSLNSSLKLLSVSALLFTGWFLIKHLLRKEKELELLKIDYLKFKRDEDFFIAALGRGKMPTSKNLDKGDQVVFGNSDGEINITAYTDPLCDYCKDAFLIYDELLERYPNEISLEMIFVTTSNSENTSYQIVRRILELYDLDTQSAYVAIKNWFKIRDYDVWYKEFGTYNSHMSKYGDQIKRQVAISLINNIMEIPETIIFGCKYPRKLYSYKDLLLHGHRLKEIKKRLNRDIIKKEKIIGIKEFLQG